LSTERGADALVPRRRLPAGADRQILQQQPQVARYIVMQSPRTLGGIMRKFTVPVLVLVGRYFSSFFCSGVKCLAASRGR
jgi:hypothetical protein